MSHSVRADSGGETRSTLATLAVIEAVWFLAIIVPLTLAGSSVALNLLFAAAGVPMGWALARVLLLGRPSVSSRGPKRRFGSSEFFGLLVALWGAWQVSVLVFVVAAATLSLISSSLPYLLGGALAGFFLPVGTKLLSARPRFEDEPKVTDERLEQERRRSERSTLAMLIAVGLILALYTLAFLIFVLLEYIVPSLIRSFAG